MVERLKPSEVWRRLQAGELRLIDLRDPWERIVNGRIDGAIALDGQDPLPLCGDQGAVALICQRGMRSASLARRLAEVLGNRVHDVEGGVEGWLQAGLPVVHDHSEFSPRELERYQRHFPLPEVGPGGQLRLKRSRVLLVGAGGLGSPAALYLAAAGVGTLVIVDDDHVERSNLQRQLLHDESTLGWAKSDSAKRRLEALNPDIRIRAHRRRLDDECAESLVADADLVIDGCDNFPTRQRLNRACVRHRKPLVYGAVERFAGQVGVFAGRSGQPCYRCLFAELPAPGQVQNCAEAGVFGVVPGVVGCLQAAEALKLLLDTGQPLWGRLLVIDLLSPSFRIIRVPPDPACPECGHMGDT